jgi:hypothetical protein
VEEAKWEERGTEEPTVPKSTILRQANTVVLHLNADLLDATADKFLSKYF